MCKISEGVVLLFLLAASVMDVKTRRISSRLLIGMSAAILCLCFQQQRQNIVSVIGGLFIGIVFCFISKFTEEAIGYGDSWIITLLGLHLGAGKLVALVMAAFFLAGIFSLGRMLRRRWSRICSIPFVPFLTAAYVGVLLL